MSSPLLVFALTPNAENNCWRTRTSIGIANSLSLLVMLSLFLLEHWELFPATRHLFTAAVSIFGTITLLHICWCSNSQHLLGCHTRYYANYYVHQQATLRTYYAQCTFKYLQTSKHIFIASDLCELFANMMVTSWYVEVNHIESMANN